MLKADGKALEGEEKELKVNGDALKAVNAMRRR